MHAWNASRKCRRMASAEFRAPSANEAAVVAGDGEVIRVVRHPTALRARGMNRYPAMRWRHSRSFTQPPVSFALRAETNDSSVHEQDVGQPKAEVAARRLRALNSLVDIVAVAE